MATPPKRSKVFSNIGSKKMRELILQPTTLLHDYTYTVYNGEPDKMTILHGELSEVINRSPIKNLDTIAAMLTLSGFEVQETFLLSSKDIRKLKAHDDAVVHTLAPNSLRFGWYGDDMLRPEVSISIYPASIKIFIDPSAQLGGHSRLSPAEQGKVRAKMRTILKGIEKKSWIHTSGLSKSYYCKHKYFFKHVLPALLDAL